MFLFELSFMKKYFELHRRHNYITKSTVDYHFQFQRAINVFQKILKVSNNLDPNSGPEICKSDLGPNCLHKSPVKEYLITITGAGTFRSTFRQT